MPCGQNGQHGGKAYRSRSHSSSLIVAGPTGERQGRPGHTTPFIARLNRAHLNFEVKHAPKAAVRDPCVQSSDALFCRHAMNGMVPPVAVPWAERTGDFCCNAVSIFTLKIARIYYPRFRAARSTGPGRQQYQRDKIRLTIKKVPHDSRRTILFEKQRN
jgi:hypothetical protein